MTITTDAINSWADDLQGPVALVLKQKLVSVEGEDAVIFPPTYAGIGYNIDELSDGTKVATIDSVGSQANRMEPLFIKAPVGRPENPLAKLVPQIDIILGNQKRVSILDVGHRLGDALIRCSELGTEAAGAFLSFQEHGDAGAIARLAPTSLVFGAWDSRGQGAKLPRLINSVIRAWDVTELKRAAQYNPPVNYTELEIFGEDEKAKAEGDSKSPLAKRGFVHVPSTGEPGGIIAKGGIYRDVTVNLTALRRLDTKENGTALRRYILGLALAAATDPQDGFLRQGCLLTPDPDTPAAWRLIQRNGEREEIVLTADGTIAYAKQCAKEFKISEDKEVKFDKGLAKKDVKKKDK